MTTGARGQGHAIPTHLKSLLDHLPLLVPELGGRESFPQSRIDGPCPSPNTRARPSLMATLILYSPTPAGLLSILPPRQDEKYHVCQTARPIPSLQPTLTPGWNTGRFFSAI